jgi:hypothetical protein
VHGCWEARSSLDGTFSRSTPKQLTRGKVVEVNLQGELGALTRPRLWHRLARSSA